MDSTEALRHHTVKKIEHLEHYFDRVQDVNVVLTAEKQQHITEVTVHSPGEVFKCSAATEDMYSSIDAVMEKLERHMVKRKEITKIEARKK